ncbi:hypothetical protein PPSIR1_37899 [Plesiocystis pacifica SIR-1]|uniref:Sulfatase-modifying factor enzyme domain-containing protein n=1 Tax=Plesiocystis pacifica SIR-1 TaxID=391625 RepID=A6G9L9_9BACT|nr:hypothetical protein [Plesiocystis pacifica]EDM77413.1 hypothetical protein PPSIR1_37899 [Plesiocystis pacifica SIR-1]
MGYPALRVVRGGGWHSSARFGPAACDRLALPQATANERLGFRLARYLG